MKDNEKAKKPKKTKKRKTKDCDIYEHGECDCTGKFCGYGT
jgi:hypothetical protein